MPHEHTHLKTQFLHYDSINAEYITDFSNLSGVPNSYNCQFKNHSTFKNVERIYLTSLELPVGFVNVRKGSTDTLAFNVNGSNYSVVLAEKNYSTMSVLIQDLNLACVGIVPNVVITFSQSLTVPRLLITLSGTGTISSFNIIDTNLSMYILGFRKKFDSLISSIYIASYSNYNLNADNYIHLYLPNIPGINASMGGGAKSTFKIPFNTVSNNVYFYQEQSSSIQYVDTRNSNFNLSTLTAIIYDRYGVPINPRGFDWSMTLKLEYSGL
jgi:hypothetical protein